MDYSEQEKRGFQKQFRKECRRNNFVTVGILLSLVFIPMVVVLVAEIVGAGQQAARVVLLVLPFLAIPCALFCLYLQFFRLQCPACHCNMLVRPRFCSLCGTEAEPARKWPLVVIVCIFFVRSVLFGPEPIGPETISGLFFLIFWVLAFYRVRGEICKQPEAKSRHNNAGLGWNPRFCTRCGIELGQLSEGGLRSHREGS